MLKTMSAGAKLRPKRNGQRPVKFSTVLVGVNLVILFGIMWVLYSSMSDPQDGAAQRPRDRLPRGKAELLDDLEGPVSANVLGQQHREEAAEETDNEALEVTDVEEGEESQVAPATQQTKAPKKTSKAVPPPVRVDIQQAPVVRPLPAKYQKLWEELKNKQQAVLTLPRLRKGARISCGGTGTMGFKTWSEIRNASPNLNQTLPVRGVSIPDLAAAVEASPCFKDSKYKKPGCEFFVPKSKQEGPEPLCAVVGNSGKLRYQHWQNEIDSCDIVIRFNNGPTKNFESNVGTKSTLRLFNGPMTGPKQAGEITIAELRDLAIRHWVKSWMKRPPGETLAFVMDPELICHAWDWVDQAGEKPSSGITGMILALHLCRHVHVFGFSANDYFDKTMRPHYYDWERPKPGREDVHPFAQEARIYRILQDAGKLTIHE